MDFIVILCCILIVGGVFGTYVYKRIKHLPTGECSCCVSKGKKKKNKLVEEYHKMKRKNPNYQNNNKKI